MEVSWAGELDFVVTVAVAAAGERSGCLIGFATHAGVVPAGREHLAELFGSETGDEVDVFERCSWHPGPAGVPVVDGCPGWFAGRVLERLDAGDHQAVLLEPFEAAGGDDVSAFTFHRARQIEAGHEA